MKKLILSAMMLAIASAAVASPAEARPRHKPHKVCVVKHHHRVCKWR